VCYAASLRGESPSLVELKATTEYSVDYWIEIPNQERKSIEFDTNYPVRLVKHKIAYLLGISFDNQELAWNGQVLDGGKSMKDYPEILPGDTLNVVPK